MDSDWRKRESSPFVLLGVVGSLSLIVGFAARYPDERTLPCANQ